MPPHSRTSSLMDDDYYTLTHSYTHSTTSSASLSSQASHHFPVPPTSTHPSSSSTPNLNASRQTFAQRPAPARITIPSFSAFRAHSSKLPIPSPTSDLRHPLPSPGRPASTSITEKASPRLATLTTRPLSLRSPILRRPTHHEQLPSSSPQAGNSIATQPDSYGQPPATHRITADRQANSSSFIYLPAHDRNTSIDSHLSDLRPASSHYDDSRPSSIPIHSRYAHERTSSHAPKFSESSIDFVPGITSAQRFSALTTMNGATKAPPSMKIELDGVRRTLTDDSLSSLDSPNATRPKSPGGRLGNFFPWKRPGPESPSTAFSDHSLSPMPSPLLQRSHSMDNSAPRAKLTPPSLEIQRAHMHHRSEYFDSDEMPLLIGTPETNAHVKELEKELTQVSTELAESIKREMELEDEIERIRTDMPTGPASETARRSSDYFSDSGASSNRFPIGDTESRIEQLEQKLRRAEQEKASIKVEMASRLQTELGRRRDLELMVHKLEEQFQNKMDEDEQRGDMEERVEELETTIEDAKRRFNQERQAKASFEDLYVATKGELERHINQHDNLRDEVVPQLKSRIDGLEAEVADNQALMYENSRMQQEMAAFKSKMHARFGSIAEEEDGAGNRSGLSRSGSLARNPSRRGGSLSRAADRVDGTRGRSGSSGAVVSVEGLKEIEDQRDALHKALKLLIVRSGKQQKDHERAIKKLTNAKNIAEYSTPGKGAYHKEVSFLKEEVATLRKRTEDALEQKWQYEKGLSGIKMDLDRAELETRGLRIILQEHDILGSSQKTLLNNGQDDEGADQQLQQSIFTAETERDQTRKVALEYRQRAQAVGASDSSSSTELLNCAKRMDELADQLEKQVQSNVALRKRLADAVARGEREQRESSGKIGEMQKRLASMEDSVLAAQQHSESTLGTHEAEVRKLEEASSPSLQRLRLSVANSNVPSSSFPHFTSSTSPRPPLSPLLIKSPRLGSKKLSENSLLEMSKTQMLERKVKELEALLREAEEDMQDVVTKVNHSQLEVAELQNERDSAFSQMRKLQAMIVAEREKGEGLMKR